MTTIKRSDFLRNFANKELDLSKLEGEAREKLEELGETPANVAVADLNRDGKISGERELRRLFKYFDDFDRNGSARSFIADRDGQMTKAGKLYSTLSLLFSEIQGTTLTPEQLAEIGQKMAEGGATSIDEKMRAHRESIEKTGIGIYYGDHSRFKDMTREERKEWIEAYAKPNTTPPSLDQLKEASCIGWVYENVAAAYKAAGMEERWNEIFRTVVSKGSKGTDLAKELQKDGWEVIYWNPDTRKPDDGDSEHTYTAALVKRGKPYYGIPVDHQVVNYRPSPGSSTPRDMSGIEKLKQVPFFFGLARGGRHTFVGRNGKVNEFHWTGMPDDPNSIEETPLEEWGWNSGIILVPPGTWPRD